VKKAIHSVETLTGKRMKWQYIEKAREADHICYITNLSKMKQHYSNWDITKSLDDIFEELVEAWAIRVGHEPSHSPHLSAASDRSVRI
jgi:CDP-paratose 2-epimerase